MPRLTFSRAGFLRRVKMSHESSLFVVVEGKVTDRYFLERICSSEPAVAKAGYEIYMVEQIADEAGNAAGGKDAVLAFFDYCKSAQKLSQVNSGGARTVAFMVDRDSQHVTGGRRRSPHVIYTYYADSEAHAFAEGDLVEALGAAASLDKATAAEVVRGLGRWTDQLAKDWRPWIELCYLAAALRSRTWVGLGQAHSLVHRGALHRQLDAAKLKAAKQAVRSSALYKGSERKRIETAVLVKIDALYAAGRGYELLKGKWLAPQLTGLIGENFNNSAHSVAWDNEHLRNTIAKFLTAFLDVDARGSRYLRQRLLNVAA